MNDHRSTDTFRSFVATARYSLNGLSSEASERYPSRTVLDCSTDASVEVDFLFTREVLSRDKNEVRGRFLQEPVPNSHPVMSG
jgi:hypothetical protein